MSIKQLVENAGIRHFIAVNPLRTNWVAEARSVKYRGLAVSPVRVGSKRVVLSVNRELGRSGFSFTPIALVLAIILVVVAALVALPKPHSQVKLSALDCPDLLGVNLAFDDSFKASWSNWLIDFDADSRSGNVIRFKFSAKCGALTSTGLAYATQQEGKFQIKKMVPSK